MVLFGSPPAQLVGRHREVERIRDALDSMPTRGTVLQVLGQAGIGKTTLLMAGAAEARRRSMTVLYACGAEAEQRLLYSTIHQLLRPLLPTRDRLRSDQHEPLMNAFGMRDCGNRLDRCQVGQAALELITATAERQPVVVIVDDLQWVDPASRETLDFLARRRPRERVVLLVASRNVLVPATESAIENDDHLILAPLPPPDAAALLDSHAPDLSDHQRQRILKMAEGNPLALLELPIAIRSELLSPRDAAVIPLTDRLRRAFTSRLGADRPIVRTLLLVAALQDSDTWSETLAATSLLLKSDVPLSLLTEAAAAG
ncbi:MAG: AAA family ATPase, partial [Pseudonocardiaceae bacterium]